MVLKLKNYAQGPEKAYRYFSELLRALISQKDEAVTGNI